MSDAATASIGGPVGPIDRDAPECNHGPVSFPADPDPKFYRPCRRPAVYRVPLSSAVANVPLCAWHLARFSDAYPDLATQLEADHDLGECVAEPAVTALEDRQAPDPFEAANREWRRTALDQRGRVHYASRSDDAYDYPDAILVVDGALEQETTVELRDGLDLAAYMETVRKRVGWAAFADHVSRPTGGED